MKVTQDILLLMFSLTAIHDKNKIISEFLEGMGNILQPAIFTFKEVPAEPPEESIPISGFDKNFGYIHFAKDHAVVKDYYRIVIDAMQMLGILLHRLDLYETSDKEKNRYKQIADERFNELNDTISELKLSRNAAINLVEDLNMEMEKRAESERALKESEERWQYALEGSGDGVWDWNLETNKVIYSDQWKKILGYQPEEIANDLESWDSRVHPDDKKAAYADIEAHLNGNTPDYRNEHRMKRKDGTYTWILARGKVISSNREGKPTRMIGTISDISRRIESEAKIRENERRLDTLMSNLPGMSYRCKNNPEFTMTFLSNGSLSLTGYKPNELLNNKQVSYQKLILEEYQDYVYREIKKALQKKTQYTVEYKIMDKEGKTRWVWEQGTGIKDHRDIAFLEGFVMDITARKEAEIELRQLKDDLENQVKEKTKELQLRVAELERFHQATIDREFRIKELRDELAVFKAAHENN